MVWSTTNGLQLSIHKARMVHGLALFGAIESS
jgi:hypothetical protein